MNVVDLALDHLILEKCFDQVVAKWRRPPSSRKPSRTSVKRLRHVHGFSPIQIIDHFKRENDEEVWQSVWYFLGPHCHVWKAPEVFCTWRWRWFWVCYSSPGFSQHPFCCHPSPSPIFLIVFLILQRKVFHGIPTFLVRRPQVLVDTCSSHLVLMFWPSCDIQVFVRFYDTHHQGLCLWSTVRLYQSGHIQQLFPTIKLVSHWLSNTTWGTSFKLISMGNHSCVKLYDK